MTKKIFLTNKIKNMQNRIIKFRAWDGIRMTTSGIMFNTTTGCLVVPTEQSFTDSPINNNWVLMQFSGLHDKNGKEIYEGDVIKCWDNAAKDESWGLDKEHVGVIEYTPNCYSLKIKGKQTVNTPCLKHWDNDVFLDMWCNAENIEIIGNLYENPDLIK